LYIAERNKIKKLLKFIFFVTAWAIRRNARHLLRPLCNCPERTCKLPKRV